MIAAVASTIIDRVDRALEILLTVLTGVIVATIVVDVVARYGFNNSLLFANELSRLCFIWLSFLFMPLGIARGLHVSITSLEGVLGSVARAAVFRVGLLIVALVMAAVLIGGIISVRARMDERMLALPLSVAWFYAPLVIGSVWSLVHLGVAALRGERALRDTTPQGDAG